MLETKGIPLTFWDATSQSKGWQHSAIEVRSFTLLRCHCAAASVRELPRALLEPLGVVPRRLALCFCRRWSWRYPWSPLPASV